MPKEVMIRISRSSLTVFGQMDCLALTLETAADTYLRDKHRQFAVSTTQPFFARHPMFPLTDNIATQKSTMI